MESKYQHALSLYNQGDYEGAFGFLEGETDRESLLLKAECKKQMTDQYIYLIKEALGCKEYAQARHLKETYLSKYDFDTSINAIQVPDASLESTLKAGVSSNDIIYKEIPKAQKTSYFFYLMLSGLFVLLLGGYFVYDNIYQDRINGNDLVDDRAMEEIREIPVRELFLEGNRNGLPISIKLSINSEGKIEGNYKDILNDFSFILEGKELVTGKLEIKGFNRNLMLRCDLSQISKNSYRGYIQVFEDFISDDPAEKTPIYLSNWLIDDDRRQLKSLISEWNDKHTLQESDLFELRSLFADQVFFYGQTLTSEKCIQLIKSIIEKYDTYDQKLVSDVFFTILDDGLVKCDFTKQVAVNGKSKDYEAYLIFRKIGGLWIIDTESDKTTDAYFERLRKKGK